MLCWNILRFYVLYHFDNTSEHCSFREKNWLSVFHRPLFPSSHSRLSLFSPYTNTDLPWRRVKDPGFNRANNPTNLPRSRIIYFPAQNEINKWANICLWAGQISCGLTEHIVWGSSTGCYKRQDIRPNNSWIGSIINHTALTVDFSLFIPLCIISDRIRFN